MKALERKYSKSDRIVVKAKFSAWVFARQFFLAAVLGGALAAVWVYAEQIEHFLLKSTGDLQYLTEDNLKWALLGCAGFVVLCVILQAISLYSRELIVTEDKFIYRVGIIAVKSAVINLNTIKSVEYDATFMERILGYGRISVIVDAQHPYVIRGISGAGRLSARIMKQVSLITSESQKELVKLQLSGHIPDKKNK